MTRDMRLRDRIDAGTYVDQANMRDALVAQAALSEADRSAICASATQLVTDIRGHSSPGLMEACRPTKAWH